LTPTTLQEFLPRSTPRITIDIGPLLSFSKLKAMLRKIGERTVNGPWELVGRLFDFFQPCECANYFSSCGYDPE